MRVINPDSLRAQALCVTGSYRCNSRDRDTPQQIEGPGCTRFPGLLSFLRTAEDIVDAARQGDVMSHRSDRQGPRKRPFIAMLTIAIAATAASTAAAQQASLSGVITDTTDASLPGVTVTATNRDTGLKAAAITDERGQYRLPPLAPGTYAVHAELSGFSTVVVERLELLVGQHASVPLTLSVAQLAEAVVVQSEAPLVDTMSSQVGGNVDRRQMEALPLQGRNWLELSKFVKGITANEITNTPGVADDHFQLNLDGQQITQKIAGSGFGQPRFSRESIAEFQIVTNLFDITQGRSLGTQVQAISRAGTNTLAGSFYGNFRHDRLNAPNPISKTVLPYENRQIGGTLGGPLIRDRMHYFASYEDEREPGTTFVTLSTLPGQRFATPYKNTQKSFLGRVDGQLTAADRVSLRGSVWDWSNPFVSTAHPSNSSNQTKNAVNVLGTWSRAAGSSKVQELRVGYNNFAWENRPQAGLENTPEYRFPGLTIGKPFNFPQLFYQDNLEARYDLTWHAGRHDLKIGGEFFYVSNTGTWFIQQAGVLTFLSLPSDMASRIPQDAALDPSRWNLTGLDGIAQRFDRNYHAGDWSIDVPRPTWALWIGDTWRASDRITVNAGVRWDVDLGATDPPDVNTSSIPLDNGRFSGDFGFRTGIRDLRNVAPRAGFTWNAGGDQRLVIRGGSGLYFTTPVSNVTFSPQIYSQMITATFPNDGRPGFVADPARGVESFEQALAAAPAQSPRVISPDFRNPYTWQSSIGVQRQLGESIGVDVDLTYYRSRREARTLDPNLFYDPATGYNRNPALGRPNPAYGVISYFVSTGRSDQTMLSMAVNRRFRHGLQSGATYALTLSMHDDGAIVYGGASGNNPFDNLDGEYATSLAFQRHTARAWALYQLPWWGVSTSVSYAYGSGNRYAASIATQPYGKGGTNRLNLTSAGGASSAIVVPEGVLDRWHGPAVIESGAVIPRNALAGTSIHKVDLRLQKDVALIGRLKAQLIGEVFNLFDHANYIAFNTTLSATNTATTALFGQPTTASVSRQGQLAFRLSF
jgi:hypothetical protein